MRYIGDMAKLEDDERIRQLRIRLMELEIDKTRLDIDRIRRELWWSPWIALASILTGTAAMAGIILGVAHIIH